MSISFNNLLPLCGSSHQVFFKCLRALILYSNVFEFSFYSLFPIFEEVTDRLFDALASYSGSVLGQWKIENCSVNLLGIIQSENA